MRKHLIPWMALSVVLVRVDRAFAEEEAPPPCEVEAPPAHTPHEAMIVHGTSDRYRPVLRTTIGDECVSFATPLSAAVRFQRATSFPVDRDLGEHDPGFSVSPRLRVGAIFDTGRALAPFGVHLEYEHDLLVGTAGPDPSLAGDGYPETPGFEHELRKGFVRASLARYLHVSAGWMTSHWGMGLVANDGDHGWAPGNAQFADPRGGDRVLRAQLATGPLGDVGFAAAVGGDILSDDVITRDDVLLEGDHARQIAAAVMIGQGKAHGAGFYAVFRHQEALDGSATDVRVFDLTARTRFGIGGGAELSFEAEGAVVTGTTELAPTTTFEEHDVLQAGAAVRAALDAGAFGTVIDVFLASGDQNLDDVEQNAFKADPNFEMGLVLFHEVLAAQTARGVATASDLTLVGFPSEDVDRIATRGSASDTVAVFPKLRVRPIDGLEAYGGILFAWAAVPLVDPFNTRIGGGTPRNALDGGPGNYLGTELDLGARYRLNAGGFDATVGAEFGTLRPGSALTRARFVSMEAVHLGRLMLNVRL